MSAIKEMFRNLFCTDGLCGMMQSIQAVYPQSRLRRCIVHLPKGNALVCYPRPKNDNISSAFSYNFKSVLTVYSRMISSATARLEQQRSIA